MTIVLGQLPSDLVTLWYYAIPVRAATLYWAYDWLTAVAI